MPRLTLMCVRRGENAPPMVRSWPDNSIREVSFNDGEIEVALNCPPDYHAEVYVGRVDAVVPGLGSTNGQGYMMWVHS